MTFATMYGASRHSANHEHRSQGLLRRKPSRNSRQTSHCGSLDGFLRPVGTEDARQGSSKHDAGWNNPARETTGMAW